MPRTDERPTATVLEIPLSDVDAIERAIERRLHFAGVRRREGQSAAVFDENDSSLDVAGFPPLACGRLVVTPDIYLRYTTHDDAAMIHELDHDASTLLWALAHPRELSETQTAAERGYVSWRLTTQTSLTIVSRRHDDRPVGLVKVRRLVPPGVADVGYAVHPAYRGEGFATSALRVFCEWAADSGVFHRFELGIKPGNTASIRVAERAGFSAEGRRHARLRNLDGSFADELHYSLVLLRQLCAPATTHAEVGAR